MEDLHNSRELQRPRAFQYFSATGTAGSARASFEPAAEQLLAFERRVEAYHLARKGGGKGARVFCYPVGDEWWFLIRHTAPCRRELALEEGEPRPVLYKPQKYEVLRYNHTQRDVGVRCCSKHEQRAMLRVFGSCLFGSADYFPGTAKYTLAPLVMTGRDALTCADVPGLECVRLTSVEFYSRRAPWSRSRHQAEDIFRLIENGSLEWPMKLEDITRATFEIKFRRSRRPRSLTLVPCNKALYGRDEDSRWLELWLQMRRFMVARQDRCSCRPAWQPSSRFVYENPVL